MPPKTPDPKLEKAARALIAHALAFPGASEGRPWGDYVYKIKAKSFLGLALDAARLRVTVKLGAMQEEALAYPFTEPTHHGLGPHGWVTGVFRPGDRVPIDLMKAWIDDSFHAIAPKARAATKSMTATTTKRQAAEQVKTEKVKSDRKVKKAKKARTSGPRSAPKKPSKPLRR